MEVVRSFVTALMFQAAVVFVILVVMWRFL